MLMLLLAMVISSALGFQCPPSCACHVSKNLQEFNCSGLLVRTRWDNTQAEIDCVGQNFACSKLPRLPLSSLLDILEVTNCSLTSSLACAISSLGALGVECLHFKYPRTPVTENTVRGLALKQLWIYDSDVQLSPPMDAIRTQPNLTRFLASGGGAFHLQSQPPPTNLTYVDISSRTLPRLEADVFANQMRLVTIKLWNDSIEEIDVNAFRGLLSLRQLEMDRNPIRSLDPGTFHRAPGLRVLFLNGSASRLEDLQQGVFSGLRSLEELSIENAANISMRVGSRSFASMRSLRSLTLSADVQELPADVFRGTVALLSLDLKNNKLRSLPDTIFQGMINLVKLDLTHNRIEKITGAVFAPLKHLQEIRLEYNRIVVLPPLLFTTDKLETVNLSHNWISIVEDNSIAHATSLDLSHNRITWSVQTHAEHIQTPLFNLMHQLRELNLSHNHITRVFADWSRNMVRLRRLELSFNNITELSNEDVTFLGSDDLVVDLRHNQISYIPMFFERTSPHPTLKLGNNPYNCDCKLYHIIKDINNSAFKYDAEDAFCEKPLSLKNVRLTSVATDLLTCEIPDPETPSGCDCVSRPALNRTECTCQELPVILSDSFINYFNMDLTLKTYRDLNNLSELITRLNLTDIGLTTVPYIPETVTEVDLSNNKITKVPLDVLKRNMTLHLGGNPIDCDCGSADDVYNLQMYIKNGRVKGDVVCYGGRKVEQVDVTSLCSVFLAMMLGGIVCAFAIISSILVLLYYKYSIEIKVWLYRHGWGWLLKEESLDADKSYDVFISYAHKDEKFITEKLLPKLDMEYKVCVHTRDFIPGEEIATQIYRSVSESRRTLIVFSSNFLNSLWGIEEFRAAYLQGLNDRRVRAVVILFGDIDIETVSDDIKTYLSLTTYVEWGDPRFWNKLRESLPGKVKAKDVRLKQRAEVAVEKLSKGIDGIVVEGRGLDYSKIKKGALNVVRDEDGKLINKGCIETKPIDDWKVF